jgi:hypothetical protein
MLFDNLNVLNHLAKLLLTFNREIPSQHPLNVLLTNLRSKLVHSSIGRLNGGPTCVAICQMLPHGSLTIARRSP